MDGDTLTVERLIQAPAARIFALLSDAAKHSSFDGSGTVRGTKGDSRPLSLGTRFGMSMKMGAPYTTSNEVVELEQDRRIAWRTSGLFGLVGGRTWRYELIDQGSSTIVRETWDVSHDKQRFALKRSGFPAKTKRDMERTLERLAAAVES